jgi:hypothetical protein
MTSRAVVLAYAILGLLAVGTAFASVASASSLSAEDYPAVLKGEPTVQHVFTFEGGLTAKCPVTLLRGELSGSSAEVKLEAEYQGTFEGKCTAFGLSTTASISMNGCVYVLKPESQVGEGKFSGAFDISCPEGQRLTIVAGTCEVQIGEQKNLKTAEFLNDTKEKAHTDEVTFNAAAEGSVKYLKAKDGTGCPLAGTGEKTDGSFSGKTTITGLDPTTKAGLDVYFFQLAPWTAGTYPTTLTGVQTSVQTFTFEAGQKLECGVALFDGEIGGSALEVLMTAEYEGTSGEKPRKCTDSGLPIVTVTMNGCKYRFRAIGGAKEGKFAGGVDLRCPPGAAVVVQWLNCKAQFGDESAGNAVNQNLPVTLVDKEKPEPEKDDIELSFNIEEKLFYEKTFDGFSCPLNGTGFSATGSYTGSITLSGSSPSTKEPHDIRVGP